jgi:hypothetical protein
VTAGLVGHYGSRGVQNSDRSRHSISISISSTWHGPEQKTCSRLCALSPSSGTYITIRLWVTHPNPQRMMTHHNSW